MGFKFAKIKLTKYQSEFCINISDKSELHCFLVKCDLSVYNAVKTHKDFLNIFFNLKNRTVKW